MRASSAISCAVNYYATSKLMFTAAPGSFYPAPKEMCIRDRCYTEGIMNKGEPLMRLDKYLAETAQCTRSEAKTMLAKGDVYKRQVPHWAGGQRAELYGRQGGQAHGLQHGP